MAGLTWSPASATVFTEVTGTFTFDNDDVRAGYIDWGDGTDPAGSFSNKKKYANYQWYTTTEPISSVDVTHTYTATGTFNPVVQVVNSDGFFSKYQESGGTPGEMGSNTEVSPSLHLMVPCLEWP